MHRAARSAAAHRHADTAINRGMLKGKLRVSGNVPM